MCPTTRNPPRERRSRPHNAVGHITPTMGRVSKPAPRHRLREPRHPAPPLQTLPRLVEGENRALVPRLSVAVFADARVRSRALAGGAEPAFLEVGGDRLQPAAPHGARRRIPAQRFARLGTSLRLLEPKADLDRLFFMRLNRRVRKDATFSRGGVLGGRRASARSNHHGAFRSHRLRAGRSLARRAVHRPGGQSATSSATRESLERTTMTAKSTEGPSLDVALKTLWGASRWPGMAGGEVVLSHPSWQEAYRRLDQLAAVRASGVLHGPNGVGKSKLLHHWSSRLSEKQYRLLRVAHSSLMGSDLLRHLAQAGRQGADVSPRRQRAAPGRTVAGLGAGVADLDRRGSAGSRRRLAGGTAPAHLRASGRDPAVLAHPLRRPGTARAPRAEREQAGRSRLGFCFQLAPWPADSFYEYLQQRLAEVGIHTTPFEPAAETLLLQAAQGIPRTLNALLQRAMEQAALANRRVVTSGDVQFALDTLPWLARARPTG